MVVAKALIEPRTVVGSDGVIFGELLGWGARRAIGDFAFPPDLMVKDFY